MTATDQQSAQRAAKRVFRLGISSPGDADKARTGLGLDESAEDLELAFRAASVLTEASLASLSSRGLKRIIAEESKAGDTASTPDADATGRAVTEHLSHHDGLVHADAQSLGTGEALEDIAHIKDLRTLTALVRAGTIWQRRAAILRIGERLSLPKPGPGDAVKVATELLHRDRSVDIAYERGRAQAMVGKSPTKEMKAELEGWKRLVSAMEKRVQNFWDGVRTEEPFSQLPGDERAVLMVRARDLPDGLVLHLGGILESRQGRLVPRPEETKILLLSSLRFAGDPRLVPSLAAVLEEAEVDARIEAARALAQIDDPRCSALLAAAFERAVVDRERVVLAGALGGFGDRRGAEYVRFQLQNADPALRAVALEALETLGNSDDVETLLGLIDNENIKVADRAVRALARIGDRRVLPVLARFHDQTNISRLHAEIADASLAVRARMELCGEEPVSRADVSIIEPMQGERARIRSQDPFITRIRGRISYVLAFIWLAIGATPLALRRFETAAMLRPGWVKPLIAMAIYFARRRKDTLALAEFRRALKTNKHALETHPFAMRQMTACYLRRAEVVERQGRREVALGLLEEVLSFDLRQVPSALRFETERRYTALNRYLSASNESDRPRSKPGEGS